MGSLWGLEHIGISIVTSLEENLTKLHEVTSITVDWGRSKADLVEHLMRRWGGGEGLVPLTWRSLLDVLQEMKLGELSQQVEDYLSGMY